MEIVNVYKTKIGKRCQEYVENLVGNELEGSVEIWGHKHLVNVQGAEIFYRLAQASDVKEVRDVASGLAYIISINNDNNIPEAFDVALDSEDIETFLDKYGREYHI